MTVSSTGSEYVIAMHGYDPAAWAGYFTAVTGAAETLAMLLFVVVTSALALVPQDVELLGAEIIVIVLPLAAVTVRNQTRYRRQNPDAPLLWSVSRMTASGTALLPGLLAGVSLAAHWGGGLYWPVPASLLGITGAVYSAWVLLVEIVR